MNPIDYKFALLLSNRLDRFQIKNTHPLRINCRCIICGDSQKSKSKARGWILEKDHSTTIYYCHNCATSLSFRNFLKQIDPVLYNDYLIENGLKKLNNKKEEKREYNFKTPVFRKKGSVLNKIKKISALDHNHPAKQYIVDRQIPSKQHYKIYYAEHFVGFTNDLIPDKITNMKEHGRILLPFIDEKGILFGYQGRALDNSSLRYITIMLDDSREKIFGLDEVDLNKTYYVVEGPIDSLFLDNSIAMAGSSLKKSSTLNRNAVFVFDLEPRNKQIIDRMVKVIQDNFQIVILPHALMKYGKDINEFILNGLNTVELHRLLKENTFRGLEAEMKLNFWKKV